LEDIITSINFPFFEFQKKKKNQFSDSHIRAFSHTHLVGAGLPDYGNFGVMPLSIEKPSNNMIKRHNYRSEFSHETEDIYPGYYSVYLDDHQVLAELVTTGFFLFLFLFQMIIFFFFINNKFSRNSLWNSSLYLRRRKT